MTNANEQAYHKLCCYTLSHGDPSFIHQHVVDAFAAQDARETDKPIRLTFALIGLCLHVETQFTGRQVQLAHMKLGQHRRPWPTLPLPPDRGAITASDVLSAPVGAERDEIIHQWCIAVWEAFGDTHGKVIVLARECELF